MTFVKAVSALCLVSMVYVPVKQGAASIADQIGYYIVTLNGQEIGAVNSPQIAQEALLATRGRISAEAGTLVYMDPELEIVEGDALFSTRMDADEVEEAMYSVLQDSTIEFSKQQAYTVRIDDFTVTLGSKDEVVELIDAAKAAYDAGNEFQVRMVSNDDSKDTEYGIEIVKAGIGNNNAVTVTSNIDGTTSVEVAENAVLEDGLLAIGFAENISVIPADVTADKITTVSEALADITKQTEEKTIYEVKSGDCLSTIAAQYDMSTSDLINLNTGLSETSVIGIGDQIVVTVPTPELSVIVSEEVTYDEAYSAPIQYVDDNTMYTGEYKTIQEGSEGYRKVVAVVTYCNGIESDREIIDETLITEAVPQIIKRGTLTPPSFIKPISGGILTSSYGTRWGKLHAGVDWSTPIGTAVKASAGGTVIRAGWYSGYGYCVDIQHSNGTMTRYGHLSQILVSVGQKVSQYEKIALSGNSGDSTGPHLHFEIRIGDSPVDPFSYLN
jgi:murein DD-endopeptidase MepM/ murein hydrolase activator NlpD